MGLSFFSLGNLYVHNIIMEINTADYKTIESPYERKQHYQTN